MVSGTLFLVRHSRSAIPQPSPPGPFPLIVRRPAAPGFLHRGLRRPRERLWASQSLLVRRLFVHEIVSRGVKDYDRRGADIWSTHSSSWPSQTDALECQPSRAASIAAMSIFLICIIASKARLAAARSESAIAAVSARGVICHDKPHLSLHQPQALS